jgi:hypothetical protein
VLIVALPNVASAEACLFGSAWYHLDLPRHLWGFTPRSLMRLADETGFAERRVRQYPLLFTPQSLRTAARRALARWAAAWRPAGEPAGETGVRPDARADATPPRGSGGRGQTRIFLALLAISEGLGAIGAPGEIMELVGRVPNDG